MNDSNSNNPMLSSVEKLRGELDRLMDFAKEKGGQAFSAIRAQSRGAWTPVADVIESAEEVVVRLEMPGIDEHTVETNLAGQMLTVSGEKRIPVPAASDQVHLQERGQGKFSRSIPMPVQVDADHSSASFQQGVLTVRLPKTEQARPRQIPIQSQSHE